MLEPLHLDADSYRLTCITVAGNDFSEYGIVQAGKTNQLLKSTASDLAACLEMALSSSGRHRRI